MNELILRLLKDDKIAGYLTLRCGNILYVSVPRFIESHETNWVISKPVFDSFNLCFKFGEQLVFEGDLISAYNNGATIFHNGEVKFQEGGFLVEGYDARNLFFQTPLSLICCYHNGETLKVTGNIYEASCE